MVKHLLAILGVLTHHLLVLLFLFQFVVESLELLVLGRMAVALWTWENIVHVISKRDLWAESVHHVVFIIGSMPNITSSSFLLAIILRLFIEIWGLLHHRSVHHLLPVSWITTAGVAHRVSLELVQASCNAFNLGWKFDTSSLVQNNFVSISKSKLMRFKIKLTAKGLVNLSLCSCWPNDSLLYILRTPFCLKLDDCCFYPLSNHNVARYYFGMPFRFQARILLNLLLHLQRLPDGKGGFSYSNSFYRSTASYCFAHYWSSCSLHFHVLHLNWGSLS